MRDKELKPEDTLAFKEMLRDFKEIDDRYGDYEPLRRMMIMDLSIYIFR